MKKYIIITLSLFTLSFSNSCSDSELDLYPPSLDPIDNIDTENKLQMFLNSAYIGMGSSSSYGTNLMVFGDLIGDKMFVTNANPQFASTSTLSYNQFTNDFSFYGSLYDAIMSSNIVINNTKVPNSINVSRMKAEARIIRGFAYFTLVNYYSPSPTSGINQEYGVPIVTQDYDSSIQPARASVNEVYSQIISDLQYGIQNADDAPDSKVILTKTAAKLILAKVYLTRRAQGDAQLALQYSTEIVNNSSSNFAKINATSLTVPPNANSITLYQNYFAGVGDDATQVTFNNIVYNVPGSENQPETIWELDMNQNTNNLTGVGANVSLPGYLYRIGDRRCLMFRKSFYDTFTPTDVRRGPVATGLLTTAGTPNADSPMGVWTNKYPRLTSGGNFVRNIKVLRFADAQLSRIEALRLSGQTGQALIELNQFSASRGGAAYAGIDLLNDILNERAKEFYGEGQRYLDLKRYNLPLVKDSNCTINCNVPANDKIFVLPMSQSTLSYNPNLKQYPGY